MWPNCNFSSSTCSPQGVVVGARRTQAGSQAAAGDSNRWEKAKAGKRRITTTTQAPTATSIFFFLKLTLISKLMKWGWAVLVAITASPIICS